MNRPDQIAKNLIREAMGLARSGDRGAARQRILSATRLAPANEAVWLCRVALAADGQEARQALRQVEVLNPQHPQLARARTWVEGTWPGPSGPLVPVGNETKNSSTRLAVGVALAALFAGLALLLLVVNMLLDVTTPGQTESVLATLPHPLIQFWPDRARAAADLSEVNEGLPRVFHSDLPPTQVAQRHYEQGLVWRKANRLEQARQAFEWALAIKPDFVAAGQELRLMEEFTAGVDRYQQADWAGAAAAFEPVYREDAAYLYVDEILYSAYYNLGVMQQAQSDLPAALASYRAAIEILPEVPEARQKEEELTLKLSPPRPKAAVEKRIVVDISDQRTYVYEDDELVYEFVVSTGEPGRDTAIGDFKIQSKIAMAYAATWNLDMPYWLGIYWAGPLENGFHAVPTVRHTGETMWDGYLGQRVSYGCIILSMEDAEMLYNWADLDTPVSIVP